MFEVLSSYIYISLLLVGFVYMVGRSGRVWREGLPPGPRGLPFVGSALQMPRVYPERTFAVWAKEYGDLMYAEIFGNRMIIINSQKIAHDLLERRGAKYSNRPRMVTLVELLGWEPTLTALQHGTESFRKHRKWIQGAFGESKAVQSLGAERQREVCIFLLGLMETPDDFSLHVRRYVTGLVVEAVYGHRITSLDDQYVTLMDRAMEATAATGMVAGALVDFLPFLQYVPSWMPGAAFKRTALHARKLVWEGHHVPYRMVRDAVMSGNAPPSFTSSLIESAEKAGRLHEEERDIIGAAGVIYGAATDTTKTVLLTFILAMVLHPEVYAKAQEEVTRVVGRNRLPTIEDRPNLPYIDCVLKETYRWNSPVPSGAPHHITSECDEYDGYHIPKHTTVVTNLWSICKDERIWEDPDNFRPERFLAKNALGTEELDPRNVVFGHGRRLCPGRQFADTTLFLAIANIAATLDISKARDVDGREITPEVSFTPSFISYPQDFRCAITLRSEAWRDIITEALTGLPA